VTACGVHGRRRVWSLRLFRRLRRLGFAAVRDNLLKQAIERIGRKLNTASPRRREGTKPPGKRC